MGAPWVRQFTPTSEIQITEHSGRVGAVDALNWVTRMAAGVKSSNPYDIYQHPNGESVAHVLGTLRGVRKYIRADIPLIFVFDGELSSAVRQMTDPNRATENTPYPQKEFFRESMKRTLHTLGIPFSMKYPFDGEAGAAALNRDDYADFVLSNDWDTLLFGAEIQVRNFSGRGPETLANLRALLTETGLSRAELVDVAILLGTDYNDKLRNMSAVSAIDAIKMYGSVEATYDRIGDPIPDIVDDLRDMFLDPPSFEGVDSPLLEDPPVPNPDLNSLELLLTEYEIPSNIINDELSKLERAADEAGSNS